MLKRMKKLDMTPSILEGDLSYYNIINYII